MKKDDASYWSRSYKNIQTYLFSFKIGVYLLPFDRDHNETSKKKFIPSAVIGMLMGHCWHARWLMAQTLGTLLYFHSHVCAVRIASYKRTIPVILKCDVARSYNIITIDQIDNTGLNRKRHAICKSSTVLQNTWNGIKKCMIAQTKAFCHPAPACWRWPCPTKYKCQYCDLLHWRILWQCALLRRIVKIDIARIQNRYKKMLALLQYQSRNIQGFFQRWQFQNHYS